MFSRLSLGIASIVATLTMPVAVQETHADLCLYGCPSSSPASNDIVIREIYTLSSNEKTKLADWGGLSGHEKHN